MELKLFNNTNPHAFSMLYLFFTKVINDEVIRVADNVVALVQTVFIKGKYILYGVTVLPKVHRKKESVVFF